MILHKRKVTIISSGCGDSVYVVFYHDIGYVRSKSAWRDKPTNVAATGDYYDVLIEIARKAA